MKKLTRKLDAGVDEEACMEVDAGVNEFFKRVSKMNIKDETRSGYNASNRVFLLWLDKNHPECVADFAKKALQEIFESQRISGATVKHQNKSVTAKALQLVASANSMDSGFGTYNFFQNHDGNVSQFLDSQSKFTREQFSE